MKPVVVIIERTENNYSAYLEGIDGIFAVGKSVDEIKKGIIDSIEALKEECKEFGGEIPEELKGDYDLIFKMDVRSFLDFYSNLFTKAGLERITGINQKQLWHYASGMRNPRPEQSLKLEKALHKLGEELLSINL
ncbi:type II toxin-antitoxin system HicB family antitoxin [Parabacteroides johnsonii]|uniref:type II toxin-antitoxin system HicB family antitoxin n=1 Tax=Parabacteroides johnsonii TaxID=387661 RepID=UPI0011DCE0AF|nr:type II toxin-antitoxin system HicB family antitoxin [Parabacteroides johnsonii]